MLEDGSEFAGYVIDHELGRGGMGVVYLATQTKLRRRVALKVIAPEFAQDAVFRRRFEREAEHAAALDHPNVVPVFDAGASGNHLYLAMRYVEGTDLAGLLADRGSLSPLDAAAITEQISAALDAAHARGLIHRDVKPANILLAATAPDAHAYLTDFGLTKEGASQSSLTHTGQWVGTVDYVAPEQLDLKPVDARTDVYSLGCVLFQMLSGRVPYPGTSVQKMWAHVGGDLPSLAGAGADDTAALEPVIARSLAKDPADRYPSAGDLARAATAAVAGTQTIEPERSVATGVAAAGLAPGVDEQPTEPLPRSARTVASPAGAGPTAVSPPSRQEGSRPRRGLATAAIAAALILGLGAGALVITQLDDEPQPVAEDGSGPTATTDGSITDQQGSGGAEAGPERGGVESGGSSFVPVSYKTYVRGTRCTTTWPTCRGATGGASRWSPCRPAIRTSCGPRFAGPTHPSS